MEPLIAKALLRPYNLAHDEIVSLLELEDTAELFSAAYELKCRHVGKVVSLRGLIELGNQCAKNCYYCGIRRGNPNVRRYRLSEDDVLRMARWSFEQGYGSVVLQSGEIESEENTEYIGRILKRIREFGGEDLASRCALANRPGRFTVSGARPGRTAICCGSKAPCRNCTRNCIPPTTPTPAGSSACAS